MSLSLQSNAIAVTADRSASQPLLWRALLVATAYLLGGQIDAVLESTASPAIIWPPNAILLTALLWAPSETWWAYIAAVAVADRAISWPHVPWLPALGLYVGNSGQCLLAAVLIRWRRGRVARWDRVGYVLEFILWAAVVAPGVAAIVGAASVHAFRPEVPFWSAWRAWFVANALTNLLLVPVLSIGVARWLSPRRSPARDPIAIRDLEAGVAFCALIAMTFYVYEWAGAGAGATTPLLYAPWPILIWAALRFGPGGVAGAQLVLAGLAIHGAVHGRGPFAAHSTAANVLQVQLFLLAVCSSMMLLAAVTREREQTVAAIDKSEREAQRRYLQLATIYRTTPIGLAFLDTELHYVSANQWLAETAGRSVDELVGRSIREIWSPERAGQIEPLMRRVLETGRPEIGSEIVEAKPTRQDGQHRSWEVSYYPVRDAGGVALGVNVVVRELTGQRIAERELRDKSDALQSGQLRISFLAGRLIAAQEEERARIARELHDGINQDLAAVSIALSKLRQRLAAGDPSLKDLTELGHRVFEITDDVRQMSHELHPGMLRHTGLVGAVSGHCAAFGAQHGIDVTFAADPDLPAVPSPDSLCLFRVVQEAMTNATKHGHALHIGVTIRRTARGIEVRVEDNGKGFDPAGAENGGGLGLISMKERARAVGGHVVINSSPARGTIVLASVPVRGHEHEPSDVVAG